MPLPGSVVSGPPGHHGIDCNTALTAANCAAMKAQGYSFCIRYVSRHATLASNDLSTAEANRILNAGLALMPVQHVALAGWAPSGALGTTNGQYAVTHVRNLGFPPGVNVWLDLEGVKSSVTHASVIDYCNAWFAEIKSANFIPGVYVGSGAILTGDEFFWRLQTKHYWKSGSTVPPIPQRGYQMIQKIIRNDKVGGVEIDRDLTQNDAFGDAVQWLAL
jgi:glycoside hydrolase-like protein